MEQRVEGETQSSASKEIPLWSESMLSMPEITGLADSLEFPQSPIEAGTPAVDQQKINDYRNRELELKVANQMDQTTTLFQHLYNKFYYCNFTYYLTPQGFQKYWVEQWGVVLYLWLVPSELGSLSYTAQLDMGQFVRNEIDPPTEFLQAIKQNDPEFINILDGVVELSTNYAFDGVQPPYPYTNYFAVGKISTCPLFAVGSTIQMNNWVASIRLAKFEVQRLNSLFTVRWLESPLRSHAWSDLKIEPFKSGLFRGDIKYEGPLQIRIPYSNVWRQYHVIVTNKTGQAAFSQNLQSKIFNRGKVLSTDYSRRGTMLVYNNSSSAQKGKSPLLVITNCMWVNAIFPMDEVTPEKIKNVTLAKIYGEMQLSSSIISKDLKGSSTERSLFPFIQDWREVNNLEDLGQIFQGLERRPLPKELLIMAPNHFELAKWIVSISASFGLDCDSEVADKELNEMTKIKEQEIITDYVPVIWPTALYLSVEEIGGISMESTDLAETFNRFSHYLNQKVVFSTQDKMQSWCEATAKGDWERNICDRKEIEFKYTKLMEWKEYCNQKLLENGITVTKPDVNLLVTAMSSLIPWLSEVFQKLVADGPHLPDSPKIVVQPQKELPKQEPIESNSDGSISEEERSSEGSVSEDENSERSPVKVVIKID